MLTRIGLGFVCALALASGAACDPAPAMDAGGIDVAESGDIVDAVDATDVPFVCLATRLDWGWAAGRMLPGSDCLDCHRQHGSAAGHVFSIAGTVFSAVDCPAGQGGATVRVEDSAGRVLDLTTNDVGNFYSAESLALPFRVRVTAGTHSASMTAPAQSGSCNGCHTHGDGGVGVGWISTEIDGAI